MRDHARDRPGAGVASAVLTVVLTVVLAVIGLVPTLAQASSGRSGPGPAARVEVGSEAWQLFKATNASRGRFGVSRLTLDRDVSVAARRHSLAMARAGTLFHTPDVGVYLDGIAWRVWGENIGYAPGDVGSLEQAFMQSAPHRRNILDRAYRRVAIGAVRVGGTLWVTVFFYG